MESVLRIVLPILVLSIPLVLFILKSLEILKWKKMAGHRVYVHNGEVPTQMGLVLTTVDQFLEEKFPKHPGLREYVVELIENEETLSVPGAPGGVLPDGGLIGASILTHRFWFLGNRNVKVIMRRGKYPMHWAFYIAHELVSHHAGRIVYNDPNRNHANKKLLALNDELDSRLALLKEEIH